MRSTARSGKITWWEPDGCMNAGSREFRHELNIFSFVLMTFAKFLTGGVYVSEFSTKLSNTIGEEVHVLPHWDKLSTLCRVCFCCRIEVKDEAETSKAAEGRLQSDTRENYAAYLTDKACTGTTVYLCRRLCDHQCVSVCVFDCAHILEGRGQGCGSLKQSAEIGCRERGG